MKIGAHDLDLDRGLLRRDGQPVHLRAKTFALLHHLARHAGRVVPKDELMEAVWPDVTVTEDSLTQAIHDLRQVLGNGVLRTVARRGYVLEAAPARPPDGRDGPPVVLVLPFRTLPEAGDDAALADGLVEEIIQGLGRYGLVQVIARHSAFQCRPDSLPAREAAVRLGADWFVEGTARRAGGGLRLSPALCETATGRQIWTETYVLGPQGPTDLLAAIPHRIVTRLTLDTEKRLARRPATPGADLGAWQHLVAGVAALRRYGPGVNEAARDHFRAALARDPGFALAHAYLGLAVLVIGRYARSPPGVLEEGLDHALRGVDLAPDEARCHVMVALARLWRREFAAAELAARRALDLNPWDADLMALLGYVVTLRGRPEEGIDLIEAAIRLNPLHPDWYNADMALALHQAGRHAEAIARLQCLPVLSAWRETRLAACHAALGDARGAARHLARAEALSPGWDAMAETRGWAELEHPADLQRYVAEVERALAIARDV
ncbi:MAG TPA: winged helix-turn-helix domain-containing protein [Paracoccaceae bacterium]|nr:winged helix-turn-helix domain-containing protein [Paracoccaceae bacterium]